MRIPLLALEHGHVLQTFVAEHDVLLRFLEELDAAVRQPTIDRKKVAEIARTLLAAEPHHQREERALFPRLELRGIVGPTFVMRHEHETLRAAKSALLETAQSGTADEIQMHALEIVDLLREHIAKENEILYPLAFEALGEEVWSIIKSECDTIGYCPFTPAE